MKILLVEDDAPIASVIRRGLESARYQVTVATEGETGLRVALEGGYALIILDMMLPGVNGWEICREVRDRPDSTPILILTACDSVDERVRGLELGADDYLAKPFSFPELLARVQALLRRNQVHKGRVIRIADLEIDTTAARVRRAGREVPLTPHEYALLEALAAHEGRVLSMETLFSDLLRDDESASEGDIQSLREKLGAEDAPLIYAVGSVGYTLRGPDRVPAALLASR